MRCYCVALYDNLSDFRFLSAHFSCTVRFLLYCISVQRILQPAYIFWHSHGFSYQLHYIVFLGIAL